MKAEQRDGIEYEFTTVLDLTHENYALATKDRSRIFAEGRQISENDGLLLKQWLISGSADACINGNQYLELEALMLKAGINIENYCLKRDLNSLHDVKQQVFEETCKGIHLIIERNTQVAHATEKQLQTEKEALFEQEYQQALTDIQNATSLDGLNHPADYFRGSKYENQILKACQAKSDMEGWSA